MDEGGCWQPRRNRQQGFSIVPRSLAFPTIPCHIMTMRKPRKREFSVIVERDQAGFYVASVPELPGCHTQARSLDLLVNRIREAIQLCLEVESGRSTTPECVGVQRVAVSVCPFAPA